jgi:16S rRNA processing protein RimM
MTQSDVLIIGKIIAPQGIKGAVRVFSYSDFPDRFTQKGERFLLADEHTAPVPVQLHRGYALKPNIFVVELAGISDRDQAEKLRNYLLAVPSTDLPPLAEGEFHIRELIDCQVIHQPTQQVIGKVTAVWQSGHSILEITSLNGQITALVPFVEAIVPVVDTVHQRMEITPPDGLVDQLLPHKPQKFTLAKAVSPVL